MITGASLVSLSVSLNAVSTHGACTAIFVAVSAIATGLASSVRTLGKLQIFGWIGLVSILSAFESIIVVILLEV